MNDEASLRSILEDLIDLFGWEDKTPLHAALHVRNAVDNLRADLAVARNRIDELTVKLDAAERSVTRAGLDDLLAHVRALVAEHAEMRTTIEQHKAFWRDLP